MLLLACGGGDGVDGSARAGSADRTVAFDLAGRPVPLPSSPSDAPSERWHSELPGSPRDAVVTDDLVVVVSEGDDQDENVSVVAAFGRDDGERVWEVTVDRGSSQPVALSLVAGEGQIIGFSQFVGPEPGPNLFALQADTGKELWSLDASGVFAVNPIDGGFLVNGTFDGRTTQLMRLDPDGGEQWRADALGSAISEDGTTVFVGGTNLLALDVEDGVQRWSTSPGKQPVAPVSLGDVVAAAFTDSIVGFDAGDGAMAWEASGTERDQILYRAGQANLATRLASNGSKGPAVLDSDGQTVANLPEGAEVVAQTPSGIFVVLERPDEGITLSRTWRLIDGDGKSIADETEDGARPFRPGLPFRPFLVPVADGVVYTLEPNDSGNGGEVAALDFESLERRWAMPVDVEPDRVAAVMAIEGGLLVFTGDGVTAYL
jgi:outer membrane protein assembly factor BamB